VASSLSVATTRTAQLAGLVRQTRRLWLPWIPVSIMLILVICAAFAPLLSPHDPTRINMLVARTAPGETITHPLGTEVMGRDMLSRLIYGARTSVFISLIALSIGAAVGTVLGLIAGYCEG
jgi:peptide/nickel transport system permease protein